MISYVYNSVIYIRPTILFVTRCPIIKVPYTLTGLTFEVNGFWVKMNPLYGMKHFIL